MKFVAVLALAAAAPVFAQSYPSPTFNNTTINGTATIPHAVITGGTITGLSPPLPVPSGGTNSATPSGAALDNITGFSSTGFLTRTGSGAYSFQSLTNGITLGNLAQQAANTVLANATGSTANVTAFSMPGCGTSSSALQWASGSGFACNSAINAATLGGASAASYALLASPVFTGTPTAPTQTTGSNNSDIATTAYVANGVPCPSILDHGGDPTYTNDNTTALANTLAVGPNGNACAYFPPGKYKFSSQASYTLPKSTATVTIRGAGAENTTLAWPAGGGLKINYVSQYNSAHIRDMSLTTGTTSTGSAIYLNQTAASISNPGNTALSDITNVTIRGDDGQAATDYWTNGVLVSGVSNINFTNVGVFGNGTSAYSTLGTGVSLSGSSAVPAVVYNFSGLTANALNVGLNYGSWVQGVTIANSNFTGDSIGISVPASETGLDQLSIVNTQFNDSTGVNLLSALENTTITSSLFLVPANGTGINAQYASLLQIIGNTFNPSASSLANVGGVTIGTTTGLGATIAGNAFYNLSGVAMGLTGGSSGAVAYGNQFGGNGTNISDSGSSNHAAFSLGSVGYEWSPNGELHEWGTSVVTTDASGSFTVALPKAFPGTVHRCMAVNGDSSINVNNIAITAASVTTSTLAGKMANISSATPIRVNWDCTGF